MSKTAHVEIAARALLTVGCSMAGALALVGCGVLRTSNVSPVYLGNVPENGFSSLAPSQVPLIGPFSSPPGEH